MEHQGKHILVVDDSQEICDLLRKILNRNGYEAICARDGIEALEKLRSGAFDLIISDVMMPRMDGFQLCREVKTDEKLKAIPVIFFTGHYTDPEDEGLFQSLDADLLLFKPMALDTLLENIRRILERSGEEKIPASKHLLNEKEFTSKHTDRITSKLTNIIAELERDRSNMQAIFDAVQVGMLLIDENTEVFRVNRVLAQLVGKEVADLIRRQPGDGLCCIHEASVAQGCGHAEACPTCPIRNTFQRVLHTGEEIRGAEAEMRLIINGEERKFCFSVSANRLVLNAAKYVLIALSDITERKRMEEALRQSEDRYRLAIDATRDGLWEWDIQTNQEFFAPRWYEIIGYSFDDPELPHTYNSWASRIHPDDYDRVMSALKNHLEKGTTYDVDYRHRHKSGEYRWQNSRGQAVFDESGKPTKMVGCISDITARKRMEDTLRESEERFRHLAAAMPDAVLVGQDGRNVYANPAAARMIGAAGPEELVGLDVFACIEPAQHEWARQQMQRALAGEKQAPFEDRFVRLDGSVLPVEISVSSFTWQGRPALQVVVRDITERKRAEDELRASNHNLQEALALANDLAVQAEMASKAKSEFLANMSHEIRTPMNGVIGMTGLLLDTDLDADQRRYAETARKSGESLLKLLNDILDFSKIEAGKLDLESLDFDLRALLDDFAATLAQRADEKGLELICAAAPDVPAYLRGDPGRLRQVLTNLAGNAIKFTSKGEIAVRANLVSETDDEALIRFSVKDTGTGIPADKQKTLFQKFTQVDASTTRKYGGTGLGLAISKQLAEMMGGEIGIVSADGRGSEFWFTARFAKRADRKHDIAPPAEIRGAHVLVVDDNATHCEVLMLLFKAWGVRAEEAPNGPMALQALYLARDAGDPFQAAILDMQMPGMDGVALARAIKLDETLKHTRLVLFASLGQRGDAKRMKEIGFAAYLTKPARHAEILDCLSAVLAGTAAAQQEQPIVTRHTIREMRRGAARILLAEDNISNQEVAVGILKKLGLRADAVANGAEAVKVLEIIPYDLVLMDVLMPEMNGFEATHRIRNPQSAVLNHQIPIIAMTAIAMQGDREKCLEAGMNDYVSKPVSPQALVEALNKWLPREAAAATEQTAGKREEAAPVPVEESEAPVFDQAGMMVRMMDDEDLARKVIGGYLEDIPRQIEALKAYLKAGDAPSARRQAHSMKSASASVGGEALRKVAFEMENAAMDGDLESITARLPELETQIARFKEVISSFLNDKFPKGESQHENTNR